MDEGFKLRAARVDELLHSSDCGFVLVTSPRADTVIEAAYFADRLEEGGLDVRGLIVNRMHPIFDDASTADELSTLVDGLELRNDGTPPAMRDLADHVEVLLQLRALSAAEQEFLGDITERISRLPCAAYRCSTSRSTISIRWRRSPISCSTEPEAARQRATSLHDRQASDPVSAAAASITPDRVVNRLGNLDDPIEARGVQQTEHSRAGAHDADRSSGVTQPPDATDERSQARRVHERDVGEVDDHTGRLDEPCEALTEPTHGEGVEFAYRTAHRAPLVLADLNLHGDLHRPGGASARSERSG